MGIGEMTILENGFCHYPDFVEVRSFLILAWKEGCVQRQVRIYVLYSYK